MDQAALTQSARLDLLRSRGHVVIEPLTWQQVAIINDYARTLWVYRDAHIPETARKRGDRKHYRGHVTDSECICLDLQDAIVAPFLFERALELTELVAKYLGTTHPLSYSANIFWTRPGANVRPDIQQFHRDADDDRFLVMFTYLTDVLADQDGPHMIQDGGGNVRPIYGKAGTAFLADTSNLHRGLKPTREERGIAWWRWGITDPPEAYKWDRNAPISHEEIEARYPEDPYLRSCLRLLVTPPSPPHLPVNSR